DIAPHPTWGTRTPSAWMMMISLFFLILFPERHISDEPYWINSDKRRSLEAVTPKLLEGLGQFHARLLKGLWCRRWDLEPEALRVAP
ncbi:MAG TPA: hypothetical protein VKU19_38815, partial [Bryobacteraceae bacterium]|nr:hypothetical protein [Bryobacteraceae bacterium]